MRLTLLCAAALAALTVTSAAQAQFAPSETEVCPATAQVYDPEFDASSQQMVYFDGKGAIRVAPVLGDGSIGTSACAGTVLSRNATITMPDLPFRAGPEWAVSQRGLEVYFTKLDKDGHAFMARIRYDGSWRTATALADSTDRGLALTSSNAADTEPSLVYAHSLGGGAYELALRAASRPESEQVLPGQVDPATGGAPRWVPGLHALTLALPDAYGTRQAMLFNADSNQLVQLTQDAGDKDEVWMWPAPELGGQLGLMTVVNGCCLRFYRQEGDTWQAYREFRAADFSSRPRIYSPELLVHGGRTYVAMILANQRVSPSDVWMVDVSTPGSIPVLLSDTTLRNISRSEPEWMVTPDAVYVYVTATGLTSRFALNRLATPIIR